MDPAGLLGLVVAFGAIFAALTIEGTALSSLLLPAPLILVFGGTIGVAIMGGSVKDTVHSWAMLPRALSKKAAKPGEAIPTIVSLAEKARREGLLALEDAAKEIDDLFLRNGLQAAIDGTDPEDLRDILEDKIDSKRRSDKVAADYFKSMGGYAPTIGIIGTVISLVHVLENLAEPAQLGHMIAAAFVATMWGILSANVLWLPLGARIKRLSDLECEQMQIVVEGLIALQSGANPRMVRERLLSLVDGGGSQDAKEAA